MGTVAFSGNGSFTLTVDASLQSQNPGAKTSTIYWEIVVTKTGNSWAYASSGSRGRVWDGNGFNLWENGNLSFDFRNGNRWVMASGYRTIQHRSDGGAEYYVHGDMNLYGLGGASTGTGWRSLPRLGRVPDAPTPLYIDSVTSSSFRYRFSGNSDGGSPIREWQLTWQERNGAKNSFWSNGNSTLVGLKPATDYTVWARGRNDAGWGPYSSPMSVRTHSGARIRHNGAWREAVPYVKVNGVWRAAEAYVRQNGSWKRGI